VSVRGEWSLDTSRLGRRVRVFDRVASTNSLAAELAGDPANAGTVILADEQTSGRGQPGRAWLCPPGAGVLMSVLIFPPPDLRRPPVLAAWAAVSVCETVRKMTRLQARIKWPNDVLVRGRKVCGILVEQRRGTVVGVGLNVTQTADSLAAAGLPNAGSLAMFHRRPLDRWAVARQLIHQLDEDYDRICKGQLSTLEALWSRHTGLMGKPVVVECLDGFLTGQLTELDLREIELRQAGNQAVHLPLEKIRHIEVNVSGRQTQPRRRPTPNKSIPRS
jgi:BirA family biotin operon repressor/biotin-[acetyl-CoA-carboxylase] ligase